MSTDSSGWTAPAQASSAPAHAKRILSTLIIVAAVANLPLAMANVALPSIGAAFDASQTQLNLVAVPYSLGKVSSYAMEDGQLQLKFADDAGKMDFNNGGRAP